MYYSKNAYSKIRPYVFACCIYHKLNHDLLKGDFWACIIAPNHWLGLHNTLDLLWIFRKLYVKETFRDSQDMYTFKRLQSKTLTVVSQ